MDGDPLLSRSVFTASVPLRGLKNYSEIPLQTAIRFYVGAYGDECNRYEQESTSEMACSCSCGGRHHLIWIVLEKQNNFNQSKSVIGKTVFSLNATKHASYAKPFYRSFSDDKGGIPEMSRGEVGLKFTWERFKSAHRALPLPRNYHDPQHEERKSRWVEVNVWEAETYARHLHQSSQAIVAHLSLGRKNCITKPSFHKPATEDLHLQARDDRERSSMTLHEWGEVFRFRFPPVSSSDIDSAGQYLFATLYHKSIVGRESFIGQVCVFLEHDLEDGEQITGWFPLLDKYGQRDAGREASSLGQASASTELGDKLIETERGSKSRTLISSIGRLYLSISICMEVK